MTIAAGSASLAGGVFRFWPARFGGSGAGVGGSDSTADGVSQLRCGADAWEGSTVDAVALDAGEKNFAKVSFLVGFNAIRRR